MKKYYWKENPPKRNIISSNESVNICDPFSFTYPPPFQYYPGHMRAGTMQFLWCGFHLSTEERQQDPFCNPALLPCATTECGFFREEAPLCEHLVREGSGGK
ncbi:MAG: hypothetical protein WC525_06675 [Candidatus Thermoplasmatota archaeon]